MNTKDQSYTITPSNAKMIAQLLAMYGVRNNTDLEELHSGITPSSKTGDYSDVYVVSPYGKIPWMELSRISDTEMRSLMLSIETALTGALKSLTVFEENHKKILPEFTTNARTYDDPRFGEYSS